MFRSTFVLAALTAIATPAIAQDQPVTVFVVRHAEKADDSRDPSLSEAGRARAQAIAQLLADSKVTAIYTSQFKRTQETGAPLAAKLGVTSQTVDAGNMEALVAAIHALPAGSRALVVSHSNLVPVIVERLSGEKAAPMTDAEYDRIYAVNIKAGGGSGSVLYLHVGGPAGTGTPSTRP